MNHHQDAIRHKAIKLHQYVTAGHAYYAPRCCAFSLLEERFSSFPGK